MTSLFVSYSFEYEVHQGIYQISRRVPQPFFHVRHQAAVAHDARHHRRLFRWVIVLSRLQFQKLQRSFCIDCLEGSAKLSLQEMPVF